MEVLLSLEMPSDRYTRYIKHFRKDEIEKMPIHILSIFKKTIDSLQAQGIYTIGNLISKSSVQLCAFPGFCNICLQDVQKQLNKLDLKLKGD